MNMRQIVFCFLAVSLFFSCKPAEKSASLTGTKWVLESMNGREVKLKEPTSEVFMTLEDGKVNGKAGCNSFFGSYELGEGNQLDFGPMGATKMACPDMDIEVFFFTMLDSTRIYTIEGNKLSLKDVNEGVLGVFKAEKEQVDK